MRILTFDVESTTKSKGHPFTPENKLVCLGYKWLGEKTIIEEYDDELFNRFDAVLASASLVVGFNLKFDLHWIRRIGCNLDNIKAIWDVQLAYFMLKCQNFPYPSLNEVAEEYGFGQKIDVIANDYWEKGIDTIDIPKEILYAYTEKDVELTEDCFIHQYKLFTGKEI